MQPDICIETVPLAKLLPYAANARTHSDAQIKQIAASIKEFGFTVPVLVDEHNVLVAGHGRVLAAQQLGMAEAPVIRLAHLTEPQLRAFRIADNQIASSAGWDATLLRAEMLDLKAFGFDVALTGFSVEELAALTVDPDTSEGDPDAVPEPEAEAITVPGDVWILGRHRLLCGDSTNPQHIAALTAGALADLCFTSPPYGNQRDYKTGGISDWDALMQGVFSVMPVKHEAQVLVNLGMIHREGEWIPYWDGWVEWMRAAGWRRFGWYVWDQGPGLPGDWNGRLAPSHEFVFHFNRVAERARKTKEKNPENVKLKGGTGIRQADGQMSGISSPLSGLQPNKIPDSVIRIMRHKGALQGGVGSHPAVFPVDLVSEMLTAFSDPDDTVYEPFCGSGTQLISAQKNGRTCLAMELAPVYVDVSVRRWQAFTGQQAKLERTGETFDAVAGATNESGS